MGSKWMGDKTFYLEVALSSNNLLPYFQKLKDYAKIGKPIYGVNDRDTLALQFPLYFAEGGSTNWQLTNAKDVKAVLTGTKAFEVSRLEGKVVEAFKDDGMLKGLSINENLI